MSRPKWYEIKAKAGTGRSEIYMYGVIVDFKWGDDEVAAKEFIDNLKPLGDIDLHINSNGGSVPAGNAIYNALRRHPGTVDVYIDGMALSVASVIAMAGHRVIMPANAVMMIHNPAGGAWGTAEDMRKAAEMLDRFKVGLVTAYQEKTGLKAEEIERMMAEETWMTAEEAVKLGFADEIEQPIQMAAEFDLSHYRKVPQALFNQQEAKKTNTTLMQPTPMQPTPEAFARMSKETFQARK